MIKITQHNFKAVVIEREDHVRVVSLSENLLNKGQCLCVCLFNTEIQTAGRIWKKFGTEVVLKGRKVIGGFRPGTPTPWVWGA